jgi:hypothetical protein
LKLRRFGASVNSAATTTGAATTRADADAGRSGEEGKGVGRRSGITIKSFSCALECKLQTVGCLTLVGTEGITGPMLGFKAFHSAEATLAGIETAHMIRKGQLHANGLTAFQQFAALAA